MTFPRGRRYGAPLSPQQDAVFRLVADGFSADEIASRVGVAAATTHAHMANVRAKLGARSNPHAVLIAYRKGILK